MWFILLFSVIVLIILSVALFKISNLYKRRVGSKIMLLYQDDSYAKMLDFLLKIGMVRESKGGIELLSFDTQRFSIKALGTAIGSLLHHDWEGKNRDQIFKRLTEEIIDLERKRAWSDKDRKVLIEAVSYRHHDVAKYFEACLSKAWFQQRRNEEYEIFQKKAEKVIKWNQ